MPNFHETLNPLDTRRTDIAEIIYVDPNDEMPEPSNEDNIRVITRFSTKQPGKTVSDLHWDRVIGPSGAAFGREPLGQDLTFEQAVAKAERIAADTGIQKIYAQDQTKSSKT